MKTYFNYLVPLPLLALFFLSGCDSDSKSEPNPDDNYKVKETEYSIEGDNAVLKYASHESEKFDIPAEITINNITYPVTKIGKGAFHNNETIKTLSLPASIKEIDEDAFAGTDITNLYIENIESWCKINFKSLSSNPITKLTKVYIEDRAVETLTIPSTVSNISSYAFANLSFEKLILEEGVKKIGDYAFYDNNLLYEITVPCSLLTFGDFNFSKSPVTRINISDIQSWINIDKEATPAEMYDDESWTNDQIIYYQLLFDNYDLYIDKAKVEKITINYNDEDVINPASKKVLPSFSFAGANIKSIEIADGYEEIGTGAFYNCRNLEETTLPESLTRIGKVAFYQSSLEKVDLPYSLTYLGAYSFSGTNIKTITVPSGISELKNGVFAACSNLSTVDLCDNITTIGEDAFLGCIHLENIRFPLYLETVLFNAFSLCKSLTEINFPEGMTADMRSLADNSKLTSLSYPSTIGNISETFQGCNALRSLEIKAIEVPGNSYSIDTEVAENCILYIPAESVEKYKNDKIWGKFKHIEGRIFQ